MAESKSGSTQEGVLPLEVYTETKPEVPEGAKVDYIPIKHHDNLSQTIGWRRVSTEPAGGDDPGAFFIPPEAKGGEEQLVQKNFFDKVDAKASSKKKR